MAELIDARSEVERRTAQLIELRAGRWHRLAGSTWNLRRSRLALATFAAGLALVLASLILVVVVADLWFAWIAVFVLGVAAVAIAAVRAHRAHVEGEARWLRRLERDAARIVELGADGLSATPREATGAAAQAAAPATRAQTVIERKLVPAPAAAAPADERWR